MRRFLLATILIPGWILASTQADPGTLPPLTGSVPPGVPVVVEQGQPLPGQPLPGIVFPAPCTTCEKGEAKAPPSENVFKNVPPVHPLPRTGNFSVPPSGPGAYTLLEELVDVDRKGPPKYPYPPFGLIQPPFFDISWAYLDDPKLPATEHDYMDFLKRVHVGDNFLFSSGGQTWWRHMDENNSRLSGRNNTYDLWRLRSYADLWYRDLFRVYTEFITAQSFNQDLAPLPIDRNFADLLNAFVEVKLGEIDGRGAYVRIGRQEMLLGSQRLISTLDWANTRRTFQGVRAYHVGEQWDFDLFWMQPVVPNATELDSADNNKNFVGAWLTHRPKKGTFMDFYYLWLDDTNSVTGRGIRLSPYNVHTLGTRAVGNEGSFLYDVELMLQVGEQATGTLIAGAAHAGAGWEFKKLPTKPVFWLCYDYASGDNQPNQGAYSTFNPLFPFGHFYLGWIDLVNRQNIHDVYLDLYLYPTNWMVLWIQYHHLQLAARRDALYSLAGVPIRRDPTGRAGSYVGEELDIVLNMQLSLHSSLQLGYSRLFAGEFLRKTATTPGAATSPDLFYMMYSYRW